MDLDYTANSGSRPVISTVAPRELGEILSSGDDAVELARQVIEYQLKCYEEYKSAPPLTPPGVPSLVDLMAGKMDASAVDEIPEVVLSRHIWEWHSVPYTIFRAALTRMSADSAEPAKKKQKKAKAPEAQGEGKDIDDWIISHEKYMRDNERLGQDWQHGLVSFQDADCEAIFPGSVKSTKARTLTRLPNISGYKILDAKRSPKIDIQPSLAAFRRKFESMSDGLLKGLNWNNVIVAGGIVLGGLLSVSGAGDEWKASDIDMYFYGLTPTQANAKIAEIFSRFKANLPPRSPVLIVRNAKTITFYSRYPLRRIQIVLKLVKSPRAVLLNFDLDICAMCYDGTNVWMLPRAARALETGYNVFTMSMIQGHYLSERRATQEQRVFKYADRGYGLRILPSYISSLKESETKLDSISRGEVLFGLDADKIAAASRQWTRAVVDYITGDGYTTRSKLSHVDLDNKHQLSSEPQGRSCLTGFSLLMRHVALWEIEKTGEIEIQRDDWASTTYGNGPESVLAYDDSPSYTWGEKFNIPDFKQQIAQFNLRHVEHWLPYHSADDFYETYGISDDGEELKSAARLTHATAVATILNRGHDIIMPLLLPPEFADYANTLVGEALADAGLKHPTILIPVGEPGEDANESEYGFYIWRISKEVMWQQLDRRIDEIFEVLYAFYRINDRPYGTSQSVRLLTQLSKRAIRSTIEDEFDAFARWIGRQPIFVDRFYNSAVELEEIDGQEEQYTAKDGRDD
ncbi:hypothetical protein R3P38DRAFT_3253024 [Favolaschia claudopus]|uniref:Uncharacterized protein n=1 Tax=Favolaschia claudopus TaxID=2862362 RepID=A0AAW0E0V9_9AGAR